MVLQYYLTCRETITEFPCIEVVSYVCSTYEQTFELSDVNFDSLFVQIIQLSGLPVFGITERHKILLLGIIISQ